MQAAQILIAGAGPTGLVLAISLARRGIPFRIIDKSNAPGQASRALVVHARTLEFYRQLGFAEDVVASGIKLAAIHLREGGKEAGAFALNDMGEGLSPFPFALCFPQDDHERLLVAKLQALGVAVEWGTELREFSQNPTRVLAVLHNGQREEVIEVAYLCGCDGARSLVRETLNLGFPGGTYNQKFFVADVKIDSVSQNDIFLNLGADTFVLMMPVRSSGMQRLVGIIPKPSAQLDNLSFEDVRASTEGVLGLHVDHVNWFSSYHVHHRVAERFRADRCFVLGDAAHIHSPVGGQGMNTGIGDAINLSWKLAEVLQNRAGASLLDTYEQERIAFARALVSTTDRAFQGLVNQGRTGRVLRTWIMPHLVPFLFSFKAVRRAMFRTISQVHIHYRDSALSQGRAGRVRGGDRLPWAESSESDNFAPLNSLAWQVHVYGIANAAFTQQLTVLNLPLHTFAWTRATEKAGFQQDAAYLVRPDGYVALALPDQDASSLKSFLTKHGLTFFSGI